MPAEPAVCAVNVAAAQPHDPAGPAAKRLHSRLRILQPHGIHVNDHVKVAPRQIFRKLADWDARSLGVIMRHSLRQIGFCFSPMENGDSMAQLYYLPDDIWSDETRAPDYQDLHGNDPFHPRSTV